jgi:hypothetical protein
VLRFVTDTRDAVQLFPPLHHLASTFGVPPNFFDIGERFPKLARIKEKLCCPAFRIERLAWP